MKRYEVLEHTADLKIRAFGKTKEELFESSLFAMTEEMRPELDRKEIKTEITVKSSDLSALLVDFLGEALYQSQVNKAVYNKVTFEEFEEKEIKAVISGKKVKRIGLDIKAATYHELEVSQTKDGWQAIVLFDI